MYIEFVFDYRYVCGWGVCGCVCVCVLVILCVCLLVCFSILIVCSYFVLNYVRQ